MHWGNHRRRDVFRKETDNVRPLGGAASGRILKRPLGRVVRRPNVGHLRDLQQRYACLDRAQSNSKVKLAG